MMTLLALLIFSWFAQSKAGVENTFFQNREKKYEAIASVLNTPENPAKTTVLYAHGFGGNGLSGQIRYTKGNEHLLNYFYHDHKTDFSKLHFLFDNTKHNIVSFNFRDILINLGIYGSIPNPFQTTLAQENDIQRLNTILQHILNPKIIGFGVSRGAATWITTLGTQLIHKKIACLILESPFAHAHQLPLFQLTQNALDAVKPLFKTINPKKHTICIINTFFQNYNMHGIQPLDVVHFINKDIPILLVHSKEDSVIPINHTYQLYLKLVQAGHKNVFLLELNHGKHAKLLQGRQGELYCNVVHALFKYCNLPHEPERVEHVDLKKYQPGEEEIIRTLEKEKESKKKAQAKERTTQSFAWTYSFNMSF